MQRTIVRLIAGLAVLVAVGCEAASTVQPRSPTSGAEHDEAPADTTCRSGYIIIAGRSICADLPSVEYQTKLLSSDTAAGSSTGDQ